MKKARSGVLLVGCCFCEKAKTKFACYLLSMQEKLGKEKKKFGIVNATLFDETMVAGCSML